jgi:thioredoxin reductase
MRGMENVESGEHEVLIVGAGPAGLSAALVLGRAMVDTVLVDAGRPRAAVTASTHGFLTRDGASRAELEAAGRADLRRYETVALVEDTVGEAIEAGEGFTLATTAGRELAARRILFASGRGDELARLGIPGLERTYGVSVFPCPFCDGWERRGEPLAVFLADGAPAAHFVEIVSGWSGDLVAFTNGRDLLDAEARERLERGGVRVETAPIAGLDHEAGRLRAVELADGTSVPRAGGFVATAGAEAVLPLAERLAGRERVYFAGDVELGFAGIAEAAGDGYRVAKSIVKEIAKERWERA